MKAVVEQMRMVSMNTESICTSPCFTGCVGGGAHARLIGVEATLDALHDTGRADAREHGLWIKGLGDDHGEHIGHLADVLDGDEEAQGDIDGRHDRDDAGGDGADAAYAAEDAQAGEQGQHRAHHRGPDALGIAGQVVLEGGAGVVGLEGVEAVGEAGDEQHREHHAEEPAAQGLLNVVGRAAHPVVPVLLLVALGQGALNEGGGRADEGQQPHPEHRAVAADDRGGDDGVGHPGDVARAHPGGGGDHQSLEGGDVLAVLFLLPQHPQGLGEQPELHPAGAHGEVDPRKNQQGDENVGIQKVAGVAQERSKIDHAQIFLSFHFFAFYYSVPRPCLKIVNTPNHRAFCPLDGPIFP